MKKILLTTILAVVGFMQVLTAQVNGIATEPIVSTDPNDPIYFYIESASDGSYTFSGYTGDFRGEVIISPSTENTKLIHNTLASAPSPDHALWYIVNEGGIKVLKNKATGFYMVGSHTAGTTGQEFFWTSLNNSSQYLIRTSGAASYTCTWKNNLCDRLNIGLQLNSLTDWYFIVADPAKLGTALKLSLNSKIIECNNLLNHTAAGTDFGQYTIENRDALKAEIEVCQAIYDDPNSPINDIKIAIQNIDLAKISFINTISANPTSLLSANPNNDRWYWIRNYGTAVPYCFDKVISTGGRTAGSKYIYEKKAEKPSDNQLFRFVLNPDQTKVLSIIDKKGNRMLPNGTISDTTDVHNEFSLIVQSDGIAFWIQPTKLAPLRANEGGTIDNWKYLAGGASSWVLDFAYETKKLTSPRTITVTTANDAMGTAEITGMGQTSATNMDEKISITANPKIGYFFTKWTNLAGDSICNENPYIFTGTTDTTLVANFENGYYRDLKRYYTSTTPVTQSADRYLTNATAIVGGVEQPLFSNVTTIPNPVDSTLASMTLTGNAVINCTTPQIEIPFGTASFDIKCIGSSASEENLKWTQQNAFIDWNKDFDFLDENEAGTVHTTGADFILPEGFTRTTTIPANLPEGIYRMRVVFQEPANTNDWSVSIWTNNYIRNGVAYDFNIKYGTPSAVEEYNASNIKAFVSGNKLKVLNAENNQMTVRDITGRLITSTLVHSPAQEFKVPAVHGVYFITFKSESGKTYTTKVIK